MFEEKYDGWRIVAYKDGGSVRLLSRTGRDHGKRFPEVTVAIAALPGSTVILDGEVCVFDKHLVSQFHLLDGPGDEIATPPVLMAFDCLYLHGRDLRSRPLRDRRKALEDAVAGVRSIDYLLAVATSDLDTRVRAAAFEFLEEQTRLHREILPICEATCARIGASWFSRTESAPCRGRR